MIRCYVPGWIKVMVCLLSCPVLFGQTFTVNSRITPGGTQLKLDETLDVSFSVSATGLTQAVTPILVPTNPGLADAVSATWQGTTATTNLGNLLFKIHLYEDVSACGETISFDLFFTSAQFPGQIQANIGSAGLTDFQTTDGGQITLNDLYSDTPTLPWPVSGSEFFILDFNVPQSEVTNPNNRIYFWADYNLQGRPWNINWSFFLYSLNGGTQSAGADDCFFDVLFYLSSNAPVTEEVFDNTSGTPVQVPLAPVGGGGTGTALGSGINIWDITDIDPNHPQCESGTVRDLLNYDTVGPYFMIWQPGGFSDTYARAFRIYIGRAGGCTAFANNFGTTPGSTEFRIENFYLDSEGNVSATLNVPSAWGSTTTLNSDFEVQWLLRNNGYIQALGPADQDLNLDVNVVSLNIDDPSGFFLEARVRQVNTGAMVSTTNANTNHYLSYELDTIEFQRAEQASITGTGPDDYLDPGEIVVFPYTVSDPNGGTLPSLDLSTGLVIDSNGNGEIDSSDTLITSNTPDPNNVNIRFNPVQISGSLPSERLVELPFELLSAPVTPSVWFFVESDVTNGGLSSTWRSYFSLKNILGSVRDLNAEQTLLRSLYDFSNSTQGWTSENPSADGWDHVPATGWVGDGGELQSQASEQYKLVSPSLLLGTDGEIEFRHLPQFSFNQSGGILEYRTRTESGSFGAWDNFIDNFCSGCGIYNQFSFPSTPSSYLANQGVWMTNEDAPELVTVPVPNSLAQSGADEIQFRFLFMDPSLIFTGRSDGPTHWEMEFFNYETSRLLEDNIFRVDLTNLTFDACDEPTITFEALAPLPLTSLTFDWYESLGDLYSDNVSSSTTGPSGAIVPFVPTVNGTYNYYVRIKFNATERIVKVVVNKTQVCTTTCLTMDQVIATVRDPSWPFSKDVIDCVTVVNRLCE